MQMIILLNKKINLDESSNRLPPVVAASNSSENKAKSDEHISNSMNFFLSDSNAISENSFTQPRTDTENLPPLPKENLRNTGNPESRYFKKFGLDSPIKQDEDDEDDSLHQHLPTSFELPSSNTSTTTTVADDGQGHLILDEEDESDQVTVGLLSGKTSVPINDGYDTLEEYEKRHNKRKTCVEQCCPF